MKATNLLGAAALVTASLAGTAAVAQPGWGYPQEWGTGRQEWRGRTVEGRGWDGPGWYNGPGEHHGWYHWNGGWYQHCGWRRGAGHRRDWRCF